MEYALTSEDASDLIREWIFNEYNPEMNPSLSFSVEEYTTVVVHIFFLTLLE